MSCFCHNRRKCLHIEISHITPISLKKWIIFHESIKLISSSFPLQQYIFAFILAYLLDHIGNGIWKNTLSCSKLQIYRIWRNQPLFMSLFCNQMGLSMVVCHILYFLFWSTYNEIFGVFLKLMQEKRNKLWDEDLDFLRRNIQNSVDLRSLIFIFWNINSFIEPLLLFL